MNEYLTELDTPLLLGRGFTFGVTDDFLWSFDQSGHEWQVQVDKAVPLLFSERVVNELNPSLKTMTTQHVMTREEFDERFNTND